MAEDEQPVEEPETGYLMLLTTGGASYVVRPHIARTVNDMLEVVNKAMDDPSSDPWIDCAENKSCRWRFVEGMREVHQ